MQPKTHRRIAAAVAGSLVLYVAGTAWSIWTYPAATESRADAAIVLGASARGGGPTRVFTARIDHAVSLYQCGTVRKLIFTGGEPVGQTIPLATVAARYAIRQGVPAEAMVLEPYSRITYENLRFAKELGGAQGLRSFLVVSDPLHMRRAMRMAADLGMNARAAATPTTGYRSLGSRFRFLGRETYFYLQYIFVTRFTEGRSLEKARQEVRPAQPAAGTPGAADPASAQQAVRGG